MHDIKLIRKIPEMFDKSLEKRGECSKSEEIISKVVSMVEKKAKEIEEKNQL